jgi:phage-related protein
VAEGGAQLATGWLELVVSTKGAEKSMTTELVGAGGSAGKKAGSSIGSTLLGGIKKFAGPIAILAAGFSLKKIISDSTAAFGDLVSQTNQLQRVAGGSAKQVSGLVGALQLAGVNGSISSGALTFFAKNVGKAADNSKKGAALTRALGSSFKDAAGNVKPMSDILPGLADKFAKMPDGAKKAALAAQLFGRTGTALLPFLNKGSAGIAELTAKSASLGNVVDNVAQKTFSEAKTSTRGFDAATQGLNVTLGGVLVPIVESLENLYRAALIPLITRATGFLQAHAGTFNLVAAAIGRVGSIVGGGVTAGLSGLGSSFGRLMAFVSPIITQIGSVLGPLFKQLAPVFAALIPQVLTLAQSFSPMGLIFKALLPVLPKLVTIIGTLAATLGGALGTVLAAILPVISKLAGLLVGDLSKIFIQLVPIIGQLATVIGGALGTTITQLAPIIANIAGVLGHVLGGVLAQLMPVITLVAQIFGQVLTAVEPLIAPLYGLMTPILGLIAPLLSLVGPILKPLIGLFIALLKPILSLIAPLVGFLVPILQVVVTVLGAIIKGVVAVITWFIGLVTGSKKVQAGIRDAWGGVINFFAGMWLGIGKFFATGIKSILDFFGGLPGKVVKLLAGAGKWLVGIGQNLIQGLIDGAGSILKNIGTFFLKIVPSWILAPFKAALGIHSPSTVFAALGGHIVTGLIKGVTSGRPAVSSALSSLVGVPAFATAATAAVGNSGSSTGFGFPDHVTLVDENGSIIGRMKVEAKKAVDRADSDDDATGRGGTIV